ncbi:MAG TPA: hypothetical protein VL854_06670 [Nitrososphaeraceae archaeon]|nr:hypothetical protein [Nitrososphaeraceae archaeon]
MPFIIKNDPEAIKKIINQLNVSILNESKTHIQAAGNFAVGAGRQESHVITGHMKRNIQQQKVSETEIKILSKAIYSGYENARGSDHAFFDKMHSRTVAQFSGSLLIGNIQKVMRSKKIV